MLQEIDKKRIRKILKTDLARLGIDARIIIQHVKGTKLHRIYVISKKLGHFTIYERESLVWSIIYNHFRDYEFMISSIFIKSTGEGIRES